MWQYSLVGAFITNFDIKYMVNTLGSESFVTYWAGFTREEGLSHNAQLYHEWFCWLSRAWSHMFINCMAVWW